MTVFKPILAGVIALGLGSTASAETLRFSSFEPPVAHITKTILTPWAKDVSEASNGELDVQIFAGGTLGRSPAQQVKLVEDGVADIAWIIPGYSPGRFDQGTVAELPFLVPDATTGSRALWSLYDQGLLTGDYDKFKVIAVLCSAPNGIASTIPVTEPEDLKGVKLRAPGPTMLTAINALGAVPVGGITGPTAAESISRGLITGTFTQWGAIETFRMGEVISDYTDLPMGATPMLVLMNKAKYDSLSDTAKAAIDKFSGAAFVDRFGPSFDGNVSDAKARVTGKNDITIITPDAGSGERWKDAVAVATSDWIANTENGQAIHDAFVAALADATGEGS
ncbi:MAG: C4-dicarboxylate ABC transporter substrate-binding protein [Rhodobacteraceae bacterium]|nr:C4-dicarboxylate ABC transporter substrate-binding protein [Paracoccaceae bacterium]MAY47424.1 C4-dicarboxylate ABC transporter substrate-binding protein [Paracoccaceae bacterium]QEW19539.1 TRAP transporter solute receptor, DctP family [Marinibacterium anthonyi]